MKGCLISVAVALSGLGLRGAPASAPPPGRTIEFPGSKSDEVSTNLHELNRPTDALKQIELEESLRDRYDLFGNSMDGAQLPIARYVAPPKTKRDKERLKGDHSLDLTAEEQLLIGDRSPDPTFSSPDDSKDPDARDKTKRTRTDKFYERMDRKSEALSSSRANAANRGSQYHDEEPGDSTADGDLPPEVKDTIDGLKNLLAPDKPESLIHPDTSRDGFSDIFGLRDDKFSAREQSLLHRAHLEEYGQMLGMPSQQLPGTTQVNPLSPLPNPLGSLMGSPAANSASSYTPAAAISSPGKERFDNSFGAALSLPTGLPDSGLSGLSYSPSAGASIPSPVQDLTPPRPTFQAPRRPFQ